MRQTDVIKQRRKPLYQMRKISRIIWQKGKITRSSGPTRS
jgi:hypothetical protein